MSKAARQRNLRRQMQRRLQSDVAGHQRPAPSLRLAPKASPLPEHREDRFSRIEQFDNFAGLRNGLRRVAEDRGDWAGIPMPLEGERLVVEPNYPKAKELMELGRQPGPVDLEALEATEGRNAFWSTHKSSLVIIGTIGGKLEWGIEPGVNHFGMDLQTLGCSEAWGIEQESNAMATIAELVSHRQMKQYLLTGMFLESSKRSHVTYCFRRLRPTVALTTRGPKVKILCAMCMHPIAYYANSWAGAMCPTDDVIAHLMLMRGDEKMFWRRCNQHPAYRPAAGL